MTRLALIACALAVIWACGNGPDDWAIGPEDFVTMDRSECYGTCPSYTVKVFSDGRVAWNGRRHVKVRGEQLYRIPEADARRLLQKFKTARVWRLREQYERSVTDNPTVVVEISIGGRRKRISDYAASAPAWFRALQTGIDETAATAPFRQPDPGAGRP